MNCCDPCLNCPLPECDENDPRCPLRQVPHEWKSKWQPEIDRVAQLADGERLVFPAMSRQRTHSLQCAIEWRAQIGRLPTMRTRRRLIYGEAYELEVERRDNPPPRRWSRWSEYLDVVEKLSVGEECSFVVSTPYDLKLLQQSVYQWQRARDARCRTRRESGDRLVLYVTRLL